MIGCFAALQLLVLILNYMKNYMRITEVFKEVLPESVPRRLALHLSGLLLTIGMKKGSSSHFVGHNLTIRSDSPETFYLKNSDCSFASVPQT